LSLPGFVEQIAIKGELRNCKCWADILQEMVRKDVIAYMFNPACNRGV
jgi:hypothetical protein